MIPSSRFKLVAKFEHSTIFYTRRNEGSPFSQRTPWLIHWKNSTCKNDFTNWCLYPEREVPQRNFCCKTLKIVLEWHEETHSINRVPLQASRNGLSHNNDERRVRRSEAPFFVVYSAFLLSRESFPLAHSDKFQRYWINWCYNPSSDGPTRRQRRTCHGASEGKVEAKEDKECYQWQSVGRLFPPFFGDGLDSFDSNDKFQWS